MFCLSSSRTFCAKTTEAKSADKIKNTILLINFCLFGCKYTKKELFLQKNNEEYGKKLKMAGRLLAFAHANLPAEACWYEADVQSENGRSEHGAAYRPRHSF
jgi:hypothetical protein